MLSVICALLLFISAFTTGVYAAESETSGKCGENANWVLDKSGTLTITGEGEINVSDTGDDVIHLEGIPWYNQSKNILKVIISRGITAIGDSAFSYLPNLRDIVIPSTNSNYQFDIKY